MFFCEFYLSGARDDSMAPRFVAHNFTPSPRRQGQCHGYEVPQARVEHAIRIDQRDEGRGVRERVTYKGRELALVQSRAFVIS